MFPRKFAALVILAMLLCNITLLTQVQTSNAQLFVDTMILVDPADVSVSYGQDFSITVTNLLDQDIWVFCLCDSNISRIDAPVFLTINATSSYVFQFTAPQRPVDQYGDQYGNEDTTIDYNSSALLGGSTPTYSVYFGAVDYAATSFQTSQVLLQMTSVDTLQFQLAQLYAQNKELMHELLKLQDRAGMNNTLIAAVVISNVFWACLIIAMKLHKQTPPQTTLTDGDGEMPSPPRA